MTPTYYPIHYPSSNTPTPFLSIEASSRTKPTTMAASLSSSSLSGARATAAPATLQHKNKRKRGDLPQTKPITVKPRVRDFIAKVFEEAVNFGAIDSAFHNDLLHVIAMTSRKKPRIRLSADRLAALNTAMRDASSFRMNAVSDLEAFVQERKAQRLLSFKADKYYDSKRSSQYTRHNELAQRRLTSRTLDLVPMQAKTHELVLDIGCGSGLSSGFARAYAPRQLVGYVIGLDRSPHMLALCDQDHMDCVLYDMAQPLPFRENAFNCAISVSALHYVCHGKKDKQARAEAFMQSFAAVVGDGEQEKEKMFAMQFFPETPADADCLAVAAKKCGVSSLSLLLDYTHHTKAYRWFVTSWSCVRRCVLAEALIGPMESRVCCVLCLDRYETFPDAVHLAWAISDHCKRARQAMRQYKRDPKLIQHEALVPLAKRLIELLGENATLDELKEAYRDKLHPILHPLN